MSPKEVLEKTGGVLTAENSFLSPVLRGYYLRGYRVILPGNIPEGDVKGLLFCRPDDGQVAYYDLGVHFASFRKDSPSVIVKNYLDFVALRGIAEEVGINPVLVAVSLGELARSYNLFGFKVDRPDYGKFLVLPVEEKGGLWKLREDSPSAFKEKLLALVDAANELDEELLQLRFNQE